MVWHWIIDHPRMLSIPCTRQSGMELTDCWNESQRMQFQETTGLLREILFEDGNQWAMDDNFSYLKPLINLNMSDF